MTTYVGDLTLIGTIFGIFASIAAIVAAMPSILAKRRNKELPDHQSPDHNFDPLELPSPPSPNQPKSLGEYEQIVNEVISNSTDQTPADAWNTHLKRSLVFPFEATIRSEFQNGQHANNGYITVRRILSTNESIGTIVQILCNGNLLEKPLFEIRLLNPANPAYDLLEAYYTWYFSQTS